MTNKNSNPHIVVCAAFWQGYELLEYILNQCFKIDFVVTCQKDTTEFESKIVRLCRKKNVPVVRSTNVNDPHFVNKLKAEKVDLVILAWWPDIIKTEAINAVNIGWVNLHPTLLPYGRGKHGYYWDVVENKPFGVTIHFIDEGIDTGPILFQKQIPISIEDTGEVLYSKGVTEIIKLFKEKYSKIASLDFKAKKQDASKATYHHSREIEPHSEIHLDRNYKALDLINIIRGRTFSKGPSAYFFMNGKKYYVRLRIEQIA